MNALTHYPAFSRPFGFDRWVSTLLNNLDETSRPAQPACDLYENDERYLLRVELPGVAREQLELGYEDHRLDLAWSVARPDQGSEDEAREDDAKRRLRLRVPQGIDAETIGAHLADGILTIELPKAAEARSRRIEVA